jgi:hypothetical protein
MPSAERLKFALRHGRRYWRSSRLPGRVARARAILDGYDPDEADWYRQIAGSADGFIRNSDRERHLHGLNRHYAYVLDNKALFASLTAEAGLPHPRVFAETYRGRLHWRPGGEAALADHLGETGRFVLKPILGSKGAAIRICADRAALAGVGTTDCIATAFVQQHTYAEAIFPGALNTIRALMMRGEGGAPVLVAATHRFGTQLSAPVDNFSRNGLVAKIDRDTGRLDRAITVAADNRVFFHVAHPETGTLIAGNEVPYWSEVRALVDALGAAFPYLDYVGWDIAITGAGPVVIEGNAHPSLRFFQLYDRLTDDPEISRLFATYLPWLRQKARG